MSLILSGSEGLSDVDGTAATPAIRGTDTNTGIFFPAADTIAFAEGGVESMRLDSSGNVGIGTSSPSNFGGVNLQVQNSNIGSILWSNGTFTGQLLASASAEVTVGSRSNHPLRFGTNDTERMRIDTSGNVGIGTSSPGQKFHVYNAGSVYTQVQSVNAATGAGAIYRNATANWLIGAGPASGGSEFAFVDQTNGSGNPGERMRIDSSGNLLVGTTSQLASTSFASFSTGNGWVLGLRNTANSSGLNITNGSGTAGYSAIGFYNNGLSYSSCGTVTVSGTTTSYGTSSDYRMKKNVQPMVGALARVAALKPVTYTWKLTGEEGEGFIAHELQEVCPSAVVGEKDAVDEDGKIKPQNIDTSFLVATLTAAIQELKAELDAVKTELAALKGTA